MTYANDKDETHSLSCPFVTRDFTRGKMPMKVACTHCTTILNVKSPWSIRRGAGKNVSGEVEVLDQQMIAPVV